MCLNVTFMTPLAYVSHTHFAFWQFPLTSKSPVPSDERGGLGRQHSRALKYFSGISFSQKGHVPSESSPVFPGKVLISEHCPVKFNF